MESNLKLLDQDEKNQDVPITTLVHYTRGKFWGDEEDSESQEENIASTLNHKNKK